MSQRKLILLGLALVLTAVGVVLFVTFLDSADKDHQHLAFAVAAVVIGLGALGSAFTSDVDLAWMLPRLLIVGVIGFGLTLLVYAFVNVVDTTVEVAAAVLMLALGAGVVALRELTADAERDTLYQIGVHGRAKVLDVVAVGRTDDARDRVLRLRLLVAALDEPHYEVSTRVTVAGASKQTFEPGQVVDVYVHPGHPRRLMVELDDDQA
jgi:hypothetical protein